MITDWIRENILKRTMGGESWVSFSHSAAGMNAHSTREKR